MLVTKEAVEAIINFSPCRGKGQGTRVDLGEVRQGERLVYDEFLYQQRAIGLPGEPLIYSWTRQPILALVGGRGVQTLAYAADVISLQEPTALDRIIELVGGSTTAIRFPKEIESTGVGILVENLERVELWPGGIQSGDPIIATANTAGLNGVFDKLMEGGVRFQTRVISGPKPRYAGELWKRLDGWEITQ